MPNSLSKKQETELLNIARSDPGFKCQGKVGEFLDNWLICETLAKRLILYLKQREPQKASWSYPELISALKHFGIDYDDQKVKPAFKGGDREKRGNKTARQLRNGYLHSLSIGDKNEIETRSTELTHLLSYWRDRFCGGANHDGDINR